MKLLKFLDERLEEMICVFVLAAMTLVIFIQIIIRAISVYVTIPMAWTEEIGRYLFIYAVYVGAAYATRRRAHQKVDIFPILCVSAFTLFKIKENSCGGSRKSGQSQ